jgi:hypothetical protein
MNEEMAGTWAFLLISRESYHKCIVGRDMDKLYWAPEGKSIIGFSGEVDFPPFTLHRR